MDGAIFYSHKAAGVGVIIQDHEDKFIVGLCKKIQATFAVAAPKIFLGCSSTKINYMI